LPVPVTSAQPPYLDPNGDNSLTALDILQVINEINRRAASSAMTAQGDASPDGGIAPLATFDFAAIASSVGSGVTTPTYAGAFLAATGSVAPATPAADNAVDMLFTDEQDDDGEFAAVVADDVWSDDDFSAAIAVAQPRAKAHVADELASLWNHETQDWTRATRETIVEKRSAKRWT
jgi:hypothetical protein